MNTETVTQTGFKSNITAEQLLALALDMGEKMIACGAEANRVEDTISRICFAYGAEEVDVFSITSYISVTIKFDNLHYKTQTRRIYSYATDLDKLEYLNAISRCVCATTPAFYDIRNQIASIRPSRNFKWYITIIGFMLASGAFAMFFGGSPMDALVAAAISLVAFLIEKKLKPLGINPIIYNYICTLGLGIIACIISSTGLIDNLNMVLIGLVMIYIPGIQFTNAIRDMLSGDTISGLLRMIEAIILAVSIAVGFASAIILFNYISTAQLPEHIFAVNDTLKYTIQIITAALGALGYTILFNSRSNKIVFCIIGGAITWVAYLICDSFISNLFICNIIGAGTATMYSIILAKNKKAPVTCFLIPAVIPLIPGGSLYYTMLSLVTSDTVAFENFMKTTVISALGISVGIMFTSVIGGNYGKHRLTGKASQAGSRN